MTEINHYRNNQWKQAVLLSCLYQLWYDRDNNLMSHHIWFKIQIPDMSRKYLIVECHTGKENLL